MNQLIFITGLVFYFDCNSLHTQIGYIKQILNQPADIPGSTYKKYKTRFEIRPWIYIFKKSIMDFENSKFFQIRLTLMCFILIPYFLVLLRCRNFQNINKTYSTQKVYKAFISVELHSLKLPLPLMVEIYLFRLDLDSSLVYL